MNVGVLAFQGDFAEHIGVLRSLKVQAIEIRTLEDLNEVDRLIIPGGESTVMAQFLESTGIGKEIVRRANQQHLSVGANNERKERKDRKESKDRPLAVFGTCAGAILLAKTVMGKNAPKSLGLIDITIDRNAYGTQLQSFEAALKIMGIPSSVPVAFIRAPRITRVGADVEVLATYKGDPVLVRQGCILVATFHPEVRGEAAIHRLFLTYSRP